MIGLGSSGGVMSARPATYAASAARSPKRLVSGVKIGNSSAMLFCIWDEMGTASTNHQMMSDFFNQPLNCV
jgi:hypothetical protein